MSLSNIKMAPNTEIGSEHVQKIKEQQKVISQEAFIRPCHHHCEEKLTNLIIQV